MCYGNEKENDTRTGGLCRKNAGYPGHAGTAIREVENSNHWNTDIRELHEVHGIEAKHSGNRCQDAFQGIAGTGNQSIDHANGL